MPTVPYSAVPDRIPQGPATPNVSVNTPGAAFGENIATAVKGLGGQLEKSGDELWQRAIAMQQLQNETEAREADTKYMIAAGQLHADFSSQQGKNAGPDALRDYSENLRKTREEIGKGLSNDAARKLYDAQSLSTMGRTIFNGAGHSASEVKSWAIKTGQAQIDLDAKTVEDNPNDPGLFEEKWDRVKTSVAQLSDLHGAGEGSPQEAAAMMQAKSTLRSQQIIGMSRQEPFEAAKFLDAHKSDMTQADYLKVDNIVRSAGRTVGSVNIANEVYSAGQETPDKPAKSLRDMEAEVRQKAKELDPNDPLLATHAVTALQGVYNQDKRAKTQEEWTNTQTVAAGINQGVKNEQELRADPKIAAAIDALPETKKMAIPGMINRANASKYQTTNNENFRQLWGESNNDVEQFLNRDLTNFQLSEVDRRKLEKRAEQLKAQPNQDPRVDRAKSWLRGSMGAELQALGIFRRTDQNKDDYDKFTGALQIALDTWQQDNKKPPTYKDVVETIGPEIIKQRDEPGLIFGTNKKPFYDQPATRGPDRKAYDTFVADQKRAATDENRPEPTDPQLNQAWTRLQFIKLYGKKSP